MISQYIFSFFNIDNNIELVEERFSNHLLFTNTRQISFLKSSKANANFVLQQVAQMLLKAPALQNLNEEATIWFNNKDADGKEVVSYSF